MKHEKTNEGVASLIKSLGYYLNPMSGYKGEFYTINRYKDLMQVVDEILKNT